MKRVLRNVGFGIFSVFAILLAIPQIWAIAAPLQLIALLPILYLTSQLAVTYRKVLYAGVYMGIFYVLPQVFVQSPD